MTTRYYSKKDALYTGIHRVTGTNGENAKKIFDGLEEIPYQQDNIETYILKNPTGTGRAILGIEYIDNPSITRRMAHELEIYLNDIKRDLTPEEKIHDFTEKTKILIDEVNPCYLWLINPETGKGRCT